MWHAYVYVIYELLSSQLSTRAKFTYVNSEKKVNINSNRNCKPGANSLWFNSFTLEISLTFLGQTLSHLEMHTVMAREKAERCGFHLSPAPPKPALVRLGSGGSCREGFLRSECRFDSSGKTKQADPQMLDSVSSEGRKDLKAFIFRSSVLLMGWRTTHISKVRGTQPDC